MTAKTDQTPLEAQRQADEAALKRRLLDYLDEFFAAIEAGPIPASYPVAEDQPPIVEATTLPALRLVRAAVEQHGAEGACLAVQRLITVLVLLVAAAPCGNRAHRLGRLTEAMEIIAHEATSVIVNESDAPCSQESP